jgi:hypothetical protein
VDEILGYATQPGQPHRWRHLQVHELITHSPTGFLMYITFVAVFCTFMIYRVSPKYGTKNPMVYLSICSLVGSVSVMSIKVSSPGRVD